MFDFLYARRYTNGDVGRLRELAEELRKTDWVDEDGEVHMTPFPPISELK